MKSRSKRFQDSRTMSSHLQVDQTNLIKQIFTYCQNVTIFCSRSNMGHALQDIGPSSLLLIPARTEFLSSFLLTQPDIWQKCGSLLKQLLISKVLLNMWSPFPLSLTIYLELLLVICRSCWHSYCWQRKKCFM